MSQELWPHQQAAVRSAHNAVQAGRGSGLWVMPTGAGKTRAFVALASALGRDTLVLVHRDVIRRQVADEFGRTWPGVAVTTLPGACDPKARVLVATVQTLSRRLGDYTPGRFGLVIVDEAHHATAKTWQAVLGHFTPRFRLGVTATPERLDGQSLEPAFGPALFRYPLSQAMHDGYLVPVRQRAIHTGLTLNGLKRDKKTDAPSERSLALAVTTDERTRRVVDGYLDLASERPALFFAADVAHAQAIQRELVARGVPAAAVSGKTKNAERAQILGQFRSGRLRAVVGCEVLTEGYDEARVSCVVMARPTCSMTFYTQAVGRGLRRPVGKADCLVLDVIDDPTGYDAVTAARLFGGWAEDCGGREVRDAVAEEQSRWRLEPLRPTAAQRKRWYDGDETPWQQSPTLRGMKRVGGWPASVAQLDRLARLGFLSCRPLTSGEASHLIEECDRLDRQSPTPPSDAQLALLRREGVSVQGLTRRQAQSRIAQVMAQR